MPHRKRVRMRRRRRASGDSHPPNPGQKRPGAPVSPAKARQMLREGTAHGKPLTADQKRFFGFLAGGGTPSKTKRRRARMRRR